jgi:hypothetical protein
MRGPLRRELNNYRNRGQPFGAVPGFPGFKGRSRYAGGASPGPIHAGYPDDPYMWGVPRDYHPNLNAPAVQSDEYVTDPDWESHQVSPSHQDRVLRPFPESEPAEPEFDYDHARIMSEFFLKVMEVQYRPLAEGEEVPTLADLWDEHFKKELEPAPDMVDPANGAVTPLFEETQRRLPDFTDIAEALGHLRKVFPDDHPDIVNLRAAAHEILQHPELLPRPEDFGVEWTESKLGSGNPYERDFIDEQETPETLPAEGLFEQQEGAFEQQRLDDVLEAFEPDTMPATEIDAAMGLDAMLESDEYAEPGTLEQMVEQQALFGTGPMEPVDELPDGNEPDTHDPLAVGPYGLMPDEEINQAVDQAADEPDPYMRAQQIFDEQMQYMDNPFMMPGMGPMPGM